MQESGKVLRTETNASQGTRKRAGIKELLIVIAALIAFVLFFMSPGLIGLFALQGVRTGPPAQCSQSLGYLCVLDSYNHSSNMLNLTIGQSQGYTVYGLAIAYLPTGNTTPLYVQVPGVNVKGLPSGQEINVSVRVSVASSVPIGTDTYGKLSMVYSTNPNITDCATGVVGSFVHNCTQVLDFATVWAKAT